MLHSGAETVPPWLPCDDDAALAMLRAPPPAFTQAGVVAAMCVGGRERLVRQAIEEGVVRLEWQPPVSVVTAVAAVRSVSLLRYLVSERGVDPNQKAGDEQDTP